MNIDGVKNGIVLDHIKAGKSMMAYKLLGLNAMTLIQLVLAIVAMVKLNDWGEFDLPSARTAHGQARRISSMVYFVLLIALCWLALLATQDVAIFAYFQF